MLPDYRIRQRDTLIDITRAITSELELTAVLKLIVQNSVEVLSGHAGLVALLEGDRHYRVHQSYGIPAPLLNRLNPTLEKATDLAESEGVLERNLIAIAEEFGLGLWQVVSLPLRVRNDFLGRLYVFRIRGGKFSSNDRTLLQMFADQAAIAVHNAQLYQRLTAEKRRLDAVLEFSADGVIIMDEAHRIEMFNRALVQLTGFTVDYAIGRTFEDVIRLSNVRAGTALGEAESGGWPLTATAQPLFVEGDIERVDGRLASVEIYFTALHDRDGRLANIIADVRDISRFREADAMKSTFMSVVSHELKTPVALIKGYASTLNRKDARWDENVVRSGLHVIEEESDRLAALIDDLLDASRVEAGGLKLMAVELDIDELARDVVRKMQPQIRTHRLVADLPTDLPLVHADEARITQVLRNFINNAVKYSPEGSEILISSRTTPHEVVISVHDHGNGIPPEEQKNLFNRFYRVDNVLTRRTQGAGLGLYLCKAIIEAHQGRVWVESDGKNGSTFSFSLPRA